MDNILVYCVLILLPVALFCLTSGRFPGLRSPKLPPGPSCLPIIGNLHQIPKTGAHLKFTEWADKYGPIFSLKFASATVAVVSSPYMVKQLVDKQSAISSERPSFYIADNFITYGDHLMFLNPDQRWRQGRRLYHQFFNDMMSENQHVRVQNAEAAQLLRDLGGDPDGFMGHCKRYTNSIIMTLVTGIRTPSPTASHMRQLYEVLDGLSEIFEMGASPPVDIFPFLKWIPEGLFNCWKTRAGGLGKLMDDTYNPLVDRVIERREDPRRPNQGSYLDVLLDQQGKLQLTRHEIDLMVGNLLEGGSDTSSIMIIAFIQAMALYPDVQKEAQQEIDALVGQDRSPVWNDYEKLPYMAAVVKETMRWRPVMPMAFPHATKKDVQIDGMTVPSGSTVILNVWGLHHDSSRHPDPDVFNPRRYQGRTDLAPVYAASADYESRDHYGYGSGRRICPGMHLAERGLFVAMAKILWAFDVRQKRDSAGRPIPIDTDPVTGYTDGFLRCAKPFSVDISSRSGKRQKTVDLEFATAEQEVFSNYEVMDGSENSGKNIGKRLMAHTIDEVAKEAPEKIVCSIAKSQDLSDGFIGLKFGQLAHAVNYMSWWLEETFGRPESPGQTVTYLGANDVRYLIIVMACNKTGYAPLMSSTRNSPEAHLRLMKMTNSAKLIFSVERAHKAEEVKAIFPAIENMQIPSLSDMILADTKPYIWPKVFDEVKDELAFIAHSSGTTGFPKPICLTFGYFGALDHNKHLPKPPGRLAGVPDQLTPNDLILGTTPFFHLMGFSLLIMAVFHGIPSVILPDKPLSTGLLTSALRATKPTAALFPPSILEELSASPNGLEALSGLKCVYFGGGPLSPEAGRQVSKRTRIISFLGLTEGGFVRSLVPEDPADWSYFEWGPHYGIDMQDVGNGLSEMVLQRHERPDQQPIFHTFPDLEAYHTKDLYSRHPQKPHLWKFHGRLDDVIVLSNGEKFNPVTMEKIIEGHPMVARAVVAGLGQFQTAAVIEPQWKEWSDTAPESEFIDRIWPTVQEANRISPGHGRVMRNRIIVATRSKPFSTTPKGSTQRRLVTSSYEQEIDHVYSKPADDNLVALLSSMTDLPSITDALRNVISNVMGWTGFADHADLYSIGFDSLLTVQLGTILHKAGFETITPESVYSHPTVESLAAFLYSVTQGRGTDSSASNADRIESLVQKYTNNLGRPTQHTVMITGSTGSLGSYLLHSLLQDPDIAKIICLNRSSDASSRQEESFQQKGLPPWQLDRVEFLTVSLSQELLGLDHAQYEHLTSTVDTIIHNAWRMDFNISVHSFEPQIQSLYNLVEFSRHSVHRAHIHFISSIGAVGEWKQQQQQQNSSKILEEPIADPTAPLQNGYGQAKHICERVCLAASQRAGIPTTIHRVGQVAGPTSETGIWSPSEWLPALVATSKAVGKVPRTLGSAPMDWTPVDRLSAIITELVRNRTKTTDGSCEVFHLVNPCIARWESLLQPIREQYQVEEIGMEEWVSELESIENPSSRELREKPALKLLAFYRGLVDKEATFVVPMAVEKTRAASPAFSELGPISPELMANWIKQWGF